MTEWSTRIWVDPLVLIALATTAGGAGLQLWRKVLRPLARMAGDWHGTEARPGVPARPGVMQRLADGDERMTRIEAELTLNGGKSMKDTVQRIARQVGAEEHGRLM